MQRYKDFKYESFHSWKLIKNPKDLTEFTLLQPSLDRGDESSLIFLAKTATNQFCAVKCYPRYWGAINMAFIDAEEHALKFFKDVCKGIPKLVSDGHIVSDNMIFLPMELATKGSLFNVIRETGPLSEEELKEIVLSLLDTLSALHSKKYIHRNVNPKHILAHFDKDKMQFKLCDYKFSVEIKEKKPKEWIGTPSYMAPEIKEDENSEYDQSVDIWALGVTCYHLITGRTPQSVDDTFLANLVKGGKIVYPKYACTGISADLQSFISLCLTVDPSKRPPAEQLKMHHFLTTAKLSASPIIATIIEEEAEQLAQMFEKLWNDDKSRPRITARTSLEPYENIKLLGNGQFGEIWNSKDIRTGVQYVIKVVHRNKLMNEKTILPMIEELHLLQAFRACPYIIDIREIFSIKGNYYLVLEFCNGGDLEAYIQNAAAQLPLPIKELKLIAWNVASGLKELHAIGRIHGNLKPKNVLIVKDERHRIVDAKLCDLGLTIEVDKLSGGQTITGSIEYYAPEMWEIIKANNAGAPSPLKITNKTDVFSFGAMLYFVVTGKTPYCKGRVKGLVLDFPANVAAEVKDIIVKCLAIKEAERPTFNEILEHQLFKLRGDIPITPSIAPYIYSDYIMKEGKLGVSVMECKRTGSDNDLAVKIIDLKGRNSKEFLARFTKEIDVLLKVNMIPTVIKIHDAFFCKETLNIVMDYCNGGDLETYVQCQGKLSKEISLEEKILLLIVLLMEFIQFMQNIKCIMIFLQEMSF